MVHPGTLLRGGAPGFTYRQRFTPRQVNLQYLSCGEYELPPRSESRLICHIDEEALLFQWQEDCLVELDGAAYEMAPYDVLYIPRGARYRILNPHDTYARSVLCSAPATRVHGAHHARFNDIARREDRIRRLKGKDVYLMFDVGEPADKLIAGYTFFQPYQRSWPPHNHTDQEEVYFFLHGHGAMEVYESPETLSFVHSVRPGDAVTIPMLNYHPVFSQDEPVTFIWCIAGERYWIGDKNKEFLKGGPEAITT